jgi:MoxR-like ATPase
MAGPEVRKNGGIGELADRAAWRGQSWLLTRLAEALGLELRHYKASLLSYDTLVGYPLPDQRRGLEYIQRPASIWGAQAVFIDETARCRPTFRTKLFSIIQVRRIQGMEPGNLQYRWSAMKPSAGGRCRARLQRM